MDKLYKPSGVTVRELKDWLAQFPDEDHDTGERRRVFIAAGSNGTTSPLVAAWPMNYDGRSGDVGFFSRAWERTAR